MLFVGDTCNQCCAPPTDPNFRVWSRSCVSQCLEYYPGFSNCAGWSTKTLAQRWAFIRDAAWNCWCGSTDHTTCTVPTRCGTILTFWTVGLNFGGAGPWYQGCPGVRPGTVTCHSGHDSAIHLISPRTSSTSLTIGIAKIASAFFMMTLPIDPGLSLRDMYGIFEVRFTVQMQRPGVTPLLSLYETQEWYPATGQCNNVAYSMEQHDLVYGFSASSPNEATAAQEVLDGSYTVEQTYTSTVGNGTSTISMTTATLAPAGVADGTWWIAIKPDDPICYTADPLPAYPTPLYGARHILHRMGSRQSYMWVQKVELLDSVGGLIEEYMFS